MTTAGEVRFSFTFEDYEGALRLFRDALGLEATEEFDVDGARGVVFGLPAATLELLDVAHGDFVDDVEVGRRLGRRVRIAVRVDDLEGAGRAVAAAGAEAIAAPVVTPWRDRNQRFEIADRVQLTLFETE